MAAPFRRGFTFCAVRLTRQDGVSLTPAAPPEPAVKASPVAEPEAAAAATDNRDPAESLVPEPAVSVREATVEDIDRLDSLTLEDFAADFDRVKLPADGPLTDDDLKVAVESFLDSLRTP